MIGHLRCNAASIGLLVFALLLAVHVVEPGDDYAAAAFLGVEAFLVRVTVLALARRYIERRPR